MSSIRPYRPADRAAVYRVCLLTGDSGTEASGQYRDDTILADIYAGPYLELEPELAFVVEAGGEVRGYLVATADTRRFVERYRSSWLPGFVQSHPLRPVAVDDLSDVRQRAADAMTQTGHRPEALLVDEVDAYPAHLHINLLPSLQGQGLGRQLIRTLLAALSARGVPAVHLGVSPDNAAALAFYTRLGFTELRSSTPERPLLGIRTDAEL